MKTCPHYVAKVHPRARGEHPLLKTMSRRFLGSSPRTRGTLGRGWSYRTSERFIPAHAGNTRSRALIRFLRAVHPRARGEHPLESAVSSRFIGSSPRTRGTHKTISFAALPLSVHPRARGEHRSTSSTMAFTTGSSPRTRGTPRLREAHRRAWRFIPAHAGNTPAGRVSARVHSVHPRARGEHYLSTHGAFPSNGSSPRTRGTLLR